MACIVEEFHQFSCPVLLQSSALSEQNISAGCQKKYFSGDAHKNQQCDYACQILTLLMPVLLFHNDEFLQAVQLLLKIIFQFSLQGGIHFSAHHIKSFLCVQE